MVRPDDAPTTFRMTPTEAQLAGLRREFRFSPPPARRKPRTLTQGEVTGYEREGFVRRVPVFSPDEIARYRQAFDRLLATAIAAGKDSYSISSAHLRHAIAFDLLNHPRIVGAVCDLLGDDVVGWGAHFFCKMPLDGKNVAWHQDASYWPLTPTKTVTAWLAIDDAERENACMRFLPRSHREGLIDFRRPESTDHLVLDQVVDDVTRFGKPVDVELRAGEMSLHSDLLLHGSEANSSERRRCGLTLRYASADVRAHLGWNAKGVLVSGSDPSGHWWHRERPES